LEIDHVDGNDRIRAKQKKATKKGIILTAAIVVAIIVASFMVYFIP
jgi:hypothetical protein